MIEAVYIATLLVISLSAFYLGRRWERRRSKLPALSGHALDRVGELYGTRRKRLESDKRYRSRVLEKIVGRNSQRKIR